MSEPIAESATNRYRKTPFNGSFFWLCLFVGCPPCLRASDGLLV
jgi:hypothetical protein